MNAQGEQPGSAVQLGPVVSAEERRVLNFILDFLVRHTYQPSVREICEALDYKSTKTVSDVIARLVEKGYIEKAESRARGMRILGVELAITRMLVPPPGERPR